MPRTRPPGGQSGRIPAHEQVRRGRGPEEEAGSPLLVPSGSTLLNLALSDREDGGWAVGRVANLIGDSSSGKTLLALTAFAEMASDGRFARYRLILDDAEHALAFDVGRMFGGAALDRIEAPGEDGENSDTIQDFHLNVVEAIDRGTPFAYVLDSFDALTSVEELGRTDRWIEARRGGKEVGGTYGMEKAKLASQVLREIKGRLKHTESLLIVISQTRDNVDPLSFERRTRSGGRALRFYSSHEVWSAVRKKIRRKGRTVGVLVRIRVSKNKLTGKLRDVELPIYYDYGVDDLGSCVDWLVEEGAWRKVGSRISTPWGDMSRDRLLGHLESEGLELELRRAVGERWRAVEEGLRLGRKPRYW